jgi:formamidopyrimidine-DNA glycosylase
VIVPELPEVETIRRALEPRLVGRTIARSVLVRRDILIAPGDPHGGFSRQRTPRPPVPVTADDLLGGSRVVRLERHGKQLAIIALTRGGRERALIVQLGMTGQLAWSDATTRPHVHARWELDGGEVLEFRDPRRFGGLRSLASIDALRAEWAVLGPDGLNVTEAELQERLSKTSRSLKAALLDQCVVAGVGNIYADEALFIARLYPAMRSTRACRLDGATARLASAVVRVLHEGIEHGGSTLRDYTQPDGTAGGYQHRHAVYGRTGMACVQCGTPIRARTLAGRTTSWCPGCQRR